MYTFVIKCVKYKWIRNVYSPKSKIFQRYFKPI